MKKLTTIFLLGAIFFTVNVNANKYAVLISPGATVIDDILGHSEYWYDLFLAYEQLIEDSLGHDEIFVCYGEDGSCFDSEHDRYKLSYNSWDTLVDYNNDTTSIKEALQAVHNVSGSGDTVIVRWIIGHGDSTNSDDYYAGIESQRYPYGGLWVSEADLFRFINQVDTNDYAQRYIVWMTCLAGRIIHGSLRIDTTENTVAITSCSWDQTSFSGSPDSLAITIQGDTFVNPWRKPAWDTWHGEFNYWFTGFSAGHAPGASEVENTGLDADMNEDDTVSLMELYSCEWDSVQWSESYIRGPDLTLQNFYIDRDSCMIFEAPNYITVAGEFESGNEDDTYFTIKSRVTMVCSTGYIQLNPGFYAEEGCEFLAEIDPDLYSTSSTDLALFGKLTPLNKSNPDKPSEDNPSEETKKCIPTVFSCAQNKPNPFVRSTTINYGLPKDSEVNLVVFNIAGQAVKTLVNSQQSAGYKSVSWDGTNNAGVQIPQGTYFYVFKAGDFEKHQKMILVK